MKNFLFGGGSKEKQSEIDGLKVQLTNYQTTNTQLIEQLKSVQEQLKRREAQLSDERAIIETLRKEKSVLSNTIEKQQSDYDSMMKVKENEKKVNDKKIREMAELYDKNLKNSKEESEKIFKLQNSNKLLQDLNRNLEIKINSSNETKKLLKAKLNQKDDDIKILEDKNSELNKNLLSLQKQMRSAKKSFETGENSSKKAAETLKSDYENKLKVKDTDLELAKIKYEKLEKKFENYEFKSNKTVQIYRGHLLNAARGVWDEEVKQTILSIYQEGNNSSSSNSLQVSPQSNTSSHKENENIVVGNVANTNSIKRTSRSGSILAKLQESC